MKDNNGNDLRIHRIIVDHDPFDVTFYFEGSEEAWSANEFDRYSVTGSMLRSIEWLIGEANNASSTTGR